VCLIIGNVGYGDLYAKLDDSSSVTPVRTICSDWIAMQSSQCFGSPRYIFELLCVTFFSLPGEFLIRNVGYTVFPFDGSAGRRRVSLIGCCFVAKFLRLLCDKNSVLL